MKKITAITASLALALVGILAIPSQATNEKMTAPVTTTTTKAPTTTTTTSTVPPTTTTTTTEVPVEVSSTVITRPAPTTSTTSKPKPKPRPTTTTAKPKPAPTTTTTTEAPLPLDERVLKVARAEVGKKGSYADGGFWCAKFASWVALEAKAPGFAADGPARLHTYAVSDGRISTTPHPGDLIFIDLTGENNKNEYISHVGIVESVESDGVTIHTIEGNADSSGVVVRKTRAIGDGFVIDFAPTSKG